MKSKCVAHEASQLTFILVLDPGEEAFGAISRFAEQERLDGAALTALGGFERANLGWFDPKEKKYRSIPMDEQCEVLSLTATSPLAMMANPACMSMPLSV